MVTSSCFVDIFNDEKHRLAYAITDVNDMVPRLMLASRLI
jgi:hypothetical protein